MRYIYLLLLLITLSTAAHAQQKTYIGNKTENNTRLGGYTVDSAQQLPLTRARFPWFDSCGRMFFYKNKDSAVYFNDCTGIIKLFSQKDTNYLKTLIGSGGLDSVFNYWGTIIHHGDSIEVDTSKVTSIYQNTLKLSKSDSADYTTPYTFGTAVKYMDSNTIYITPSQLADSFAGINPVDTARIYDSINTKLAIRDTATMLSAYARIQRLVDSCAALQARLQLKLNISDTATMLAGYVRIQRLLDTAASIRATIASIPPVDSTVYATLYRLDTTRQGIYAWVMAKGYGTGTVTNISSGYGITGGPITTTGTLISDTAVLFPKLVSTLGAGTGISISGRTITNTAPDQTVTLIAGTNITIGGSYPTYTVTGTGSGTVTTTTVTPANGFAGSVANPATTPAITMSVTVTGLLKGNGSAISAAVSGTDYQPAGNYITALTGDVTATGPGSVAATLANTAVTPGSYTNLNATIDSKGRITTASSGSAAVSYTFSTGLTNLTNTVTVNLSTGISGGQFVTGGTAAADSLVLRSTTNATKGTIRIQDFTAATTYGMLSIGNLFRGGTSAFLGAAAGTMLAINNTVAADFIRCQVTGLDRFYLDGSGNLTVSGNVFMSGVGGQSLRAPRIITGAYLAPLIIRAETYNNSIANTDGISMFSSRAGSDELTYTQTSGTNAGLAIRTRYNQASGTATNYDLWVNRTVVAVGSGTQKLITAGSGGASYVEVFGVSSTGVVNAADAVLAGGAANNGTDKLIVTGSAAISSLPTATISQAMVMWNSANNELTKFQAFNELTATGNTTFSVPAKVALLSVTFIPVGTESIKIGTTSGGIEVMPITVFTAGSIKTVMFNNMEFSTSGATTLFIQGASGSVTYHIRID